MGDVTLISPEGTQTSVPEESAQDFISQGFRTASAQDVATKNAQEAREAAVNPLESLGQGLARGYTLGLSDVAQRALGGDEAARRLKLVDEAHPVYSTVGNIVGGVAPALMTGGDSIAASIADLSPVGRAMSVGKSVAALGENAGTFGQVAARAGGGLAEGAIIGAGQGVSQLAMSDDPLTWEHATSVLSSNMLFGGAIGGGASLLGVAVEKGLAKAKGALDEAAAKAQSAANPLSEDLSGLDAKGLREAQKAELASIEQSRVAARQQVADDLGAFRQELKDQKLWLATKGSEDAEVRTIGKRTLKADRQLDNLLDNPKALAASPQRALNALQQQESALETLANKSDALKATFVGDESGVRAAALDKVPAALEKNRALQQRIGELVKAPESPRLAAIENAKDALSKPADKSLTEQMLGGTIFHHAQNMIGGALGGTVGGPLGAMAGAKAASYVQKLVFGKLGKATAEQLAKQSAAVEQFAKASAKITKAAPIVATKILSSLSYGPKQKAPTGKQTLPQLFKARTDEIKAQTAYDETGVARVRPEAREAIASRLDPVRQIAPIPADRMETTAVRRLEYLANNIPRRPDTGALKTGPDKWQPADMEMRTFARVCHAVEDPSGVEHRIANGTATPEDVSAYKACYPERAAAYQHGILQVLPQLTKSLPYHQRLSLSMFTGQPVDSSMHPAVLRVLQGSFASEPNSMGGTSAPKPSPAFGSIKKSAPEPTPGQSRSQGSIR